MVAVSGGPDSMALSHLLWRYTQEEKQLGISIILTHVHHGARKESDDEEILVCKMAALWDVPCLTHHFDAKGYAKSMGQSFQEAAREWRYARWNEDMLKEDCTLLATAHHLGDQAETILYRLLRGSGAAGLAGIYPAKGSIIRPLLTFTKADILDYCVRESLPYALDASNTEPVYMRNKIRLELLPELEKGYNPRIQEALGRTGILMRWDEEYLEQQIDKIWNCCQIRDSSGSIGLTRDVFKEPEAILSRLLRRAAGAVTQEPRGLAFNYIVKIMESCGKIGWMQDLPGLKVKITDNGIWFEHNDQAGSKACQDIKPDFPEIRLKMGVWNGIPGLNIDVGLYFEQNISLLERDMRNSTNKIATFNSDLLGLSNQLVCRTRQKGDKMWFRGLGHKSLKKIFQEERISTELRAGIPLIALGTEVLWIPGIRQSDLYRPKGDSERVFCIVKSSG